nr:hypothetical protein [uncultured Desulfobacter sp.]
MIIKNGLKTLHPSIFLPVTVVIVFSMAATLGVPSIAYLPFNFFCWISPIVSLLFGLFNITIEPLDDTEPVFAEETQEAPHKKIKFGEQRPT